MRVAAAGGGRLTAGGGRLAGVDVADNDDVDVKLVLTASGVSCGSQSDGEEIDAAPTRTRYCSAGAHV